MYPASLVFTNISIPMLRISSFPLPYLYPIPFQLISCFTWGITKGWVQGLLAFSQLNDVGMLNFQQFAYWGFRREILSSDTILSSVKLQGAGAKTSFP